MLKPMEVEPSGNAGEGQSRPQCEMWTSSGSSAEALMTIQIPALDDELGEDADADVSEAVKAEQEEKRIDKIMSYVTEVYHPEPSKLIMKDEKQFVLPPWAKDRNTAKCTFCEALCQVDLPLA